MGEPFKGTINVDIRDSVPDWAPFEPPRAPDGAPSVLYIVLDDVGFSAMSSYGGPIPTPNIDRIVERGVRYTQFHTTALCSPTRSCLLTGRNHTRNSMACITEAAIGFPNASGTIPPENGMLSEILGEQGWNTYMVGKWHLCPTDEMKLASTRRNWPSGRGFERWYGFLGAETNQWYPDLVYDNHPVDQPQPAGRGLPPHRRHHRQGDRVHPDAKAIAPEKPFFLYYAPGACHAPHHAPKEWIDKFKGQFDMGYEAMREQTLARQKELEARAGRHDAAADQSDRHAGDRKGPDGKPFPALDVTPALGLAAPTTRSGSSRGWPRCTPASSRTPTITSEGCSTTWRSTEQLDNTLDPARLRQRGERRGWPDRFGQRGSVRQRDRGRSRRRTSPRSTSSEARRPTTTTANGWAMAFNTPFKMWKRYEFNGGTSDPCIISWPSAKYGGGIRERVLPRDRPRADRPRPTRRRGS